MPWLSRTTEKSLSLSDTHRHTHMHISSTLSMYLPLRAPQLMTLLMTVWVLVVKQQRPLRGCIMSTSVRTPVFVCVCVFGTMALEELRGPQMMSHSAVGGYGCANSQQHFSRSFSQLQVTAAYWRTASVYFFCFLFLLRCVWTWCVRVEGRRSILKPELQHKGS